MADKGFLGMTLNDIRFMGRVVGEPEFYKGVDGDCAFFYLRTEYTSLDQNGQWVTAEIMAPVYCEQSNRVENLIKKHVRTGRQLYVDCYYKNWEDNGALMHGFFATNIKLGLP